MPITIYPPSAYVKKDQLIKGWVNFDENTAIQGSFNVSSLTDIATGKTQVNWDTDFADATYAVSYINSTNHMMVLYNGMAAGYVTVYARDDAWAFEDTHINCVIAIGDQ